VNCLMPSLTSMRALRIYSLKVASGGSPMYWIDV
jgi:hypothetical protein